VIPVATSSPVALSEVRDATADTVTQNPKDVAAVLALAETIARQAAWREAEVKLTVKYTLGRTQPPPKVKKSPSPSSEDKGKDFKPKCKDVLCRQPKCVVKLDLHFVKPAGEMFTVWCCRKPVWPQGVPATPCGTNP